MRVISLVVEGLERANEEGLMAWWYDLGTGGRKLVRILSSCSVDMMLSLSASPRLDRWILEKWTVDATGELIPEEVFPNLGPFLSRKLVGGTIAQVPTLTNAELARRYKVLVEWNKNFVPMELEDDVLTAQNRIDRETETHFHDYESWPGRPHDSETWNRIVSKRGLRN